MDEILAFLQQYPVWDILAVAVLAVVCLLAIKLILVLFDKFIKRSNIDPLVRKILRVAVKVLLLFTAVIIVLSKLGVSVSSLIATLSVVGVALSLAVQGFLSNVFGGLQIISNHPFQIGDYVEAGGEGGTVREVGLFYTKLDTPDKKLIQIPNSTVANGNIINYSSAENRRLEVVVSVAYDNDVEEVKKVLLELLQTHPLMLTQGDLAPTVHVSAYGDSAITFTARGWCANADYWTVYFDVMDAIQPTFAQKGISFSYPHVNVHMQ